ncbi:MAG: serine hydrolase domain-containing protein, partial [Thermoanaerobaculia bacterium]
LWSGAYGLADREADTSATPETVYSICSISKLFTALSVLQLRDAGELALADPVGEHLPWFTITQAYPDGPPVTLWGLLTHSSGLPRESDFPYWSAPEFDFPTREEIRRRLGEQETLYPAERHYQYSNLGLTLAGEVVAEVSGRPYAEYVRDELLDPLGLADTRPEMPDPADEPRLATGHGSPTRQGAREPVTPFHAEGVAPAAGFSSTALDLARFASWQLRILESGGDAVLDGDTLREMQRVQWLEPDWETARGLGFGVYRVNETTFTGHSGSCPGYRSTVWIQPEDRIGAAVLANASGVSTERFVRRAHEIVAAAVAEAEGEECPDEGEAAEAEDGETPEPDDGPADRTARDTGGRNPETGGQGEGDGSEAGAPAEGPSDLERFAGTYSLQPWHGEAVVLPWKDGLAMVGLPTNDPLGDLEELRRVEPEGGNTFRRVRDDGELGETVVFEEDEDGRVVAFVQHSNRYPRVE